MNDISKSALEAANGLRRGDLEPLADYLTDDHGGKLDPIVIRALLRSIIGTHNETDWRLMFDRHPEITHHTKTRAFKNAAFETEIQTALKVRRHGGEEVGRHDSAINATMHETDLSHGTVQEHWKRRRRFINFCIAHGVLEDPFKG
jgi:hypothetical protein